MTVPTPDESRPPVEGVDFYREGAYVVFTARYHLRRGNCCESGCRHCPYGGEARPPAGEKEAEVEGEERV